MGTIPCLETLRLHRKFNWRLIFSPKTPNPFSLSTLLQIPRIFEKFSVVFPNLSFNLSQLPSGARDKLSRRIRISFGEDLSCPWGLLKPFNPFAAYSVSLFRGLSQNPLETPGIFNNCSAGAGPSVSWLTKSGSIWDSENWFRFTPGFKKIMKFRGNGPNVFWCFW